MKPEASRSLKIIYYKSIFSILYTSPLLAVDYVYDNSKLTNEQIDRLKKLRDKSSEYWKQETYLLKPTNGSSQNSLKVPALSSKTHQFETSTTQKRFLFMTRNTLKITLLASPEVSGLKKEMGKKKTTPAIF
ncbi:outer membrane autotransporter N-terminal domain, disrupted by a transposase [Neisseria gonorrhoeae]|uniref:Outer membrane autotransporter N-terminal domain, disrupted by a transposase n=1 Tax=Neisseria gonorrhoeae TaxID=485 RepID=A0A378VVX1_NEIGO|nr:outer membrane autotransporter N-terminal domain, disrupted by a transposase [Neisseria gonorrhoeae]